MIEVTILIPTAANDGTVFSSEHHTVFEVFLVTTFGGFSLLPMTVRGEWKDKEMTYRDVLRQYVVFISIVQGGGVGAAAEFARSHYSQESISVRYLGVAEIL